MKRSALVTGGTGLLGSWLVTMLLADERFSQVNVIVRGANNREAKKRLLSVIGLIPHGVDKKFFRKLKVVTGDVVNAGLGMDDNLSERTNITDIYHSAATADFNASKEAIWPTNVSGTRNVFTYAKGLKKKNNALPIRIHHISTIAVAGNSTGWFSEDEFDVGQGFNNAYEKSKYEAERIARSYFNSQLIVKIYRPSVITGDSKHGVTTNFKMLYQPLHFMSRNLFRTLPADANTHHSLVPVDRVASAILLLGEINPLKNGVYHVVNPNEVRFGDFVTIAGRQMRFNLPELRPNRYFSRSRLTDVQWALIKPFVPYFNYKLRFRPNKHLTVMNFWWPKPDYKFFKRLFNYCIKCGFVSTSHAR